MWIKNKARWKKESIQIFQNKEKDTKSEKSKVEKKEEIEYLFDSV